MTGPRFAVYWAPPPGSELAQFGNRWLGRDAETGEPPGPACADRPMGHDQAVADARRYGFHATLKPPFRLRDGVRTEEVAHAVQALAARLSPIEALRLDLASLDGFLALTPLMEHAELAELARRCVEDLDWLRAPADAGELARRRAAGLTPRQDALLLRWGYPYVMEEFRFHMTLTRRLAPQESMSLREALKPLAERACQAPIRLDSICLFVQTEPGADFTVRLRAPLRGRSQTAAASRRSD